MRGKGRLIALGGALLAAAAATPASAAPCPGPPGCERWTRIIAGEGAARAEASAAAPDGSRVALVGRIEVAYDDPVNPLGRGHRLAALAAGVEAGGGSSWQTFHRHSFMGTGGVDGLSDVTFAPDGRTAFTAGTWGKDGNRPDSDILVAAYDARGGTERWSRSFDGPARQRDVGGAVAISPDGGSVIAAGTACVRLTDRCEDWDWLVAALDPRTGEVRWEARHDSGEPNDEPRAIAVAGGTAIVTGTTGTGCASIATGAAPASCDTDTTTIGYDLADGRRRWIAHEDLPQTDDQPTAIAIHPRGASVVTTSNSAVAGSASHPGHETAVTAARDPETGRPLWRATAESANASDVAFLAGGERVVVVGSSARDVASYVYDSSDGGREAVLLHDGPVSGEDTAYSVSPAPSGGFAVGGAVRAGPALTDYDAVVVAYGADMRPAWSTVLPAIRGLNGVHVLQQGRAVVATGTSEDADGPDAVAIGLDAGPVFARCRPLVRLASSSRVTRRGLRVAGTATAGCASAVERVEVSVARRAGRRCVHLSRSGRWTTRRSCSARTWNRARGARRWSLRRTGRFVPGSYVVSSRATAAGVTGAPSARRLRLR